jgi:hypothetical protein
MKGNKFSDTAKDYARKLNDDELRFLSLRLSQRLGADLSEAIDVLQRNPDIDYWLSLSKNATEFYEMIDSVDALLQIEAKRRYSIQDKRS